MAKSDVQVDWTLLNWPIVITTLALLCAFGFIHYSGQYRDKLESAYQSEKRKLERVSVELQSLVANAKLFKEDMAKYQTFQAEGRYTPVDRVGLIETIEAVAARWRLTLLSYELLPAEQIAFTSEANAQVDERLQLHETRMNVELGLLHEGDLLRLESAFRVQQGGLFEVRACELERRQQAPANTEAWPYHFVARCQLAWYSLEVREPVQES